MKLHEDKTKFNESIIAISKRTGIMPGFIEKDYYVFYILEELAKEVPGLLFKGGTCLSSVFHLIDRFSEDIDLSLDNDHYGRSKSIFANHKVIEVCDKLGFKIVNRNKVEHHSHASFNRYIVEYPVTFSQGVAKPYIQIELVFFQKAYPSERMEVKSLINKYTQSSTFKEKYEIKTFSMSVQKLERTFVDKVFAICDYFERKETRRNSRHIYDLYKIYDKLKIDDKLKALIGDVRKDRKKSKRAVSAKDGYDINRALLNIKKSNFYKEDFETITKEMLFKKIEYNEIITVIDQIIDSNLFSN